MRGAAVVLSVMILKLHDDHISARCGRPDAVWVGDLWSRSLLVTSGRIRSLAFFAHNFLQKQDRASLGHQLTLRSRDLRATFDLTSRGQQTRVQESRQEKAMAFELLF